MLKKAASGRDCVVGELLQICIEGQRKAHSEEWREGNVLELGMNYMLAMYSLHVHLNSSGLSRYMMGSLPYN